jgi:hypothetical protein
MAAPTITPDAVQDVLGRTGREAQIQQSDQIESVATTGAYYVVGNQSAPGRARWCPITNTDSAATQAASILVSLRA